MDKRDATHGFVQGLVDGGLKTGRPSGSASTAQRPMRQLTLKACLSPHANTARTADSPSIAAPAAARTTAPEPSATTTHAPNAAPADSNPPGGPVKRRLNLKTPPKPHRKSAAHADAARAFAHAAQPDGEAGREGAPVARQHGFPAARGRIGAGGLQAKGDADANAEAGGRAETAADVAPNAAPAELDRIGGDGARVERSSLALPTRGSARGAELGLLVAAPDEEEGEAAPGEEQQGESAGPPQEEPPRGEKAEAAREDGVGQTAAVVLKGQAGAEGLAAGLAAAAVARRLAQGQQQRRGGGARGRSDARRSGGAGDLHESDSDEGGDLRWRRRRSSGGGGAGEEEDSSEDPNAAVVDAAAGQPELSRGHGARGAAAGGGVGGAAAAAAAAPPVRPLRAAAEKAKQRMKARAGSFQQPSSLASEGAPPPGGAHPSSDAGGGAAGRALESSGGRDRTCKETRTVAPSDDDGDGDGDDDAGETRTSPQVAAGAAAGADAGRAASAIAIGDEDGSEADGGPDADTDVGDDGLAGAGGATAARRRGPRTGAGSDCSAGAQATSSSVDLSAPSRDGSGGAAVASPGDLSDEDGGGHQPPALPGWDSRRPGYVDLSAAVLYRRASQRGEVERVERLPRCWGVGLLGDKTVLCNMLLQGYAGMLIQAAIRAAQQGRLGKLLDEKLIKVDKYDVLIPLQARSIEKQFDEALRRATAARIAAAEGGAAPKSWRALTKAEILANLPELIPHSKKVERVYIGEGGGPGEPVAGPSPWDDVPAMRGQASLRVKPGCNLAAAEVVGVYSGEAWLHPDWQAQGLVDARAEWDDPDHPCPYAFTAARKHDFGRFAADCPLPEPLLKNLSKLDLPEGRLRTLLEQEPAKSGQVFMTATRLGCLMAAANDPRRNLHAMCDAEADFREGGPNVEVVNVLVLGILPVMVMVTTAEVDELQHIMYSYGHDYWQLHEEEEAVCRDLEAAQAQARAELRAVQEQAQVQLEAARLREARQRCKRRELKTEVRRLRTASRERATGEKAARAEAEAARAEAEAARRREEEERRRRREVEEELRRLRAAPPPPTLQQPAGEAAPPPQRQEHQQHQREPGAGQSAEKPAGAASPVVRRGRAPTQPNWLPPRGAVARKATPGTGGAGSRATQAAAPAPLEAAPRSGDATDPAGVEPGLGPLKSLGSPLGKRNRTEDTTADADLGSPTARHRKAAAATQTQAQHAPAPAQAADVPPLPSSSDAQPPQPTPPRPPLPSASSPAAWTRGEGDVDFEGRRAAAAGPRTAAVNEPERGGGGDAASGRKLGRLSLRKSREAVAAALVAAGAASQGVPHTQPAAAAGGGGHPMGNNAASVLPGRPGSAAGSDAGQTAGRGGGAAGDGGGAGTDQRPVVAPVDLVAAAAAVALPASPAAQPQPQRRPSQSQRRRDTDTDLRADADLDPGFGAARRMEQPRIPATGAPPPAPLPSQQQEMHQRQQQQQPLQEEPRVPQRLQQGPMVEGEPAISGRRRPVISGRRGQPTRFSTGAAAPIVVDLVSDSD